MPYTGIVTEHREGLIRELPSRVRMSGEPRGRQRKKKKREKREQVARIQPIEEVAVEEVSKVQWHAVLEVQWNMVRFTLNNFFKRGNGE